MLTSLSYEELRSPRSIASILLALVATDEVLPTLWSRAARTTVQYNGKPREIDKDCPRDWVNW